MKIWLIITGLCALGLAGFLFWDGRGWLRLRARVDAGDVRLTEVQVERLRATIAEHRLLIALQVFLGAVLLTVAGLL